MFLLEKYLIEERREEIYQNFLYLKAELSEEKTTYSSDINFSKELDV